MRVELQIDSLSHSIETRDPETLARWLVEWFDATDWTPATWCMVRAWPTYGGREGEPPDWLADSAWFGPLLKNGHARIDTPEDMVKALAGRLQEYREAAH